MPDRPVCRLPWFAGGSSSNKETFHVLVAKAACPKLDFRVGSSLFFFAVCCSIPRDLSHGIVLVPMLVCLSACFCQRNVISVISVRMGKQPRSKYMLLHLYIVQDEGISFKLWAFLA